MITLSVAWLRRRGACAEGIAWFSSQSTRQPIDVLKALIREEHLSWANWLIVRMMTKQQYVAYALYAAEQVIDLYETRYPQDKRPRHAIDAAKVYLKNPTARAARAAESAAWAARGAGAAESSAWAAARAARAAESAAWAAARGAGAAESAAWAAARAARAAESAAWAAWAAGAAAESSAWAAARAAGGVMQQKILTYGLLLLKHYDP